MDSHAIDFSYFFVALALILLFVYWYLTKNYNRWTKQNVPCLPNPVPGCGHMWPVISYQEELKDFALRVYESTDASMIGFYHMRRPAVILRDAQLVESVLQTNSACFRVGSTLGNPASADDCRDESRVTRTSRHLTEERLRQLFLVVEQVSDKFGDYLARKFKELSANDCYECEEYELFSRYTTEVAASAAFATEGQCFQDKPDDRSFANIAQTLRLTTCVRPWNTVLLSTFTRHGSFVHLFNDLNNSAPRWMDKFFADNVVAAIARRRQEEAPPNDYLQFCVEANGIDAVEAIAEDSIKFFTDVSNLPTTILTITVHHLSLHQRVQDKARRDIVDALEQSKGVITYESLESMRYLEQIVLESIRFNPPMELVHKICTKQVQLNGSDGLTCVLKPNDHVFVQVFGLNGEQKYWPDPETFDPDRFNPENGTDYNRFAYLGFGGGIGESIGIRLAMLVTKLALVSLLTKFKLEPSWKREPGKGVWVNIKKLA